MGNLCKSKHTLLLEENERIQELDDASISLREHARKHEMESQEIEKALATRKKEKTAVMLMYKLRRIDKQETKRQLTIIETRRLLDLKRSVTCQANIMKFDSAFHIAQDLVNQLRSTQSLKDVAIVLKKHKVKINSINKDASAIDDALQGANDVLEDSHERTLDSNAERHEGVAYEVDSAIDAELDEFDKLEADEIGMSLGDIQHVPASTGRARKSAFSIQEPSGTYRTALADAARQDEEEEQAYENAV